MDQTLPPHPLYLCASSVIPFSVVIGCVWWLCRALLRRRINSVWVTVAALIVLVLVVFDVLDYVYYRTLARTSPITKTPLFYVILRQ